MRHFDKRKKLKSLLAKFEKIRAKNRVPLEDVDNAIVTIQKKLRKIDKVSVPTTSDAVVEEISEDKGEAEDSDEGEGVTECAMDVQTDDGFESLSLSQKTMTGIRSMQLKRMTQIQANAIPPLLDLYDVMGCAKTGSGKTLAFLIPALELMYKLKFKPFMGTGTIIISPTRELSVQTFGVLRTLAQAHNFRCSIVTGGTSRAEEAKELEKGVAILVATPGRLLDHLQNVKHFVTKNLKCLIIDEADRILDIGFQLEMEQILKMLPKRRQTMYFSATLNEQTMELAQKAVRKTYVSVGLQDKVISTPQTLQQSYTLCPADRRFDLLYNIVSNGVNKKRIVFMSSCQQVEYYHTLLNYIGSRVLAIHGQLTSTKRASVFFQFSKAKSATLLCTDILARGLDIPEVHEIVQYDPPVDPREYIHRVGRTARAGAEGEALLILRDHEKTFVKVLKKMGVRSKRVEIQFNSFTCIDIELIKAMKSGNLRRMAENAFTTYMRAYESHQLKDHFSIDKLDLLAEARSFGLRYIPDSAKRVAKGKRRKT